MFMEKWRDVKGFEGIYLCSTFGRVKNSVTGRILKHTNHTNGYDYVGLSKNKKRHTKVVHQIIAEAWLNHKPCGQKIVVDHKNGVKTDNKLYNLQLITQRHNSLKDKKNQKSGYSGVCWNNQNKKWQVRPRLKGKKFHVGYFDCPKYANKVYNHFTNYIDNQNYKLEDLNELKIKYKNTINL